MEHLGTELSWPRIIYHPTNGIKSECGTYTYRRCESLEDFVPLLDKGWKLYPPEQEAKMEQSIHDEVSRETNDFESFGITAGFTDGFQLGDPVVQVNESGETKQSGIEPIKPPEPPVIDPKDPPDEDPGNDPIKDPDPEAKPAPIKKAAKKKNTKKKSTKAAKK